MAARPATALNCAVQCRPRAVLPQPPALAHDKPCIARCRSGCGPGALLPAPGPMLLP